MPRNRQVLLDNRPNFWIEDATYLLVTLGAAGATLVYGRFFTPPRDSLLVADAFGLVLFTFIGARTAYAAGGLSAPTDNSPTKGERPKRGSRH